MRKLVKWGIVLFEILLIFSLVRGIQLSLASRQRVDDLQAKKEALLAEREELMKRYEYLESDEYLETVARDELNLAKPGETTVIVPEGVVQGVEATPEEVKQEEEANWEKWLEVITGRRVQDSNL